jgi:hypothetical protein
MGARSDDKNKERKSAKLFFTTWQEKGNFGIHCADTVSELRRFNIISPTLLCLLTQQVGMASKSTKAAENVSAPLVMLSLGAR